MAPSPQNDVDGSDLSQARSKAEIDVLGMTCAACVRRIDKALRAVDGVKGANVNLVTHRATVEFDADKTAIEDLVRAVERAGYSTVSSGASSGAGTADDPHSRATAIERAELAERRSILRDLWIASALTLPLLVLAMSHGAIPGTHSRLGGWIQFALTTPVVFVTGARFLRSAWKALRQKTADMNTLVGLGALSAWGYSTVVLLTPGAFDHVEHGAMPHLYFEAAATIIAFVLFGKFLETRARRKLTDAVRGLHALVPAKARRLVEGREEEIPSNGLRVGDQVIIRPGERIPSDGEVLRGESAVNESMLTGESMPVEKSPGAKVFGGTLNASGALIARITRTGADTALERIVAAVEAAQGSRAPVARLADRISAVFVPVVLAIALTTFGIWLALDSSPAGLATAVERAVAVLVIACPCALGLATPAAIAVGTARGAELGILFKGGATVEAASQIDTIFLDKTGTLTTGEPTLLHVIPAKGVEASRLLSLVASAEQGSEHPIARAIVAGARSRGAELVETSHFKSTVGSGVDATVGVSRVRVGTRGWLASRGVDPASFDAEAERHASLGHTPVFVAVDGAIAGLVTVADRPSVDARVTVERLRGMGIELAVLSGDRKETVAAIASELGIERVHAELSPHDKARLVAAERQKNRRVAMVGDGVNDAPALAAADVGVAMGSGADVAAASADVALLSGGIASLPRALELARATLRTIRRNLAWAFVYNVLGIPIAAGALYLWTGWLLSPILGSAAMALSSVSVLASSLVLRRFGRTVPRSTMNPSPPIPQPHAWKSLSLPTQS